ncbi:MAG: hypothetical protein ACIAS6_03080 [Phycisphaerales bacterium JB060]
MGRREFEDSFAEIGRKIDGALNAGGEAKRRLSNRVATGGLFERFQRAGDKPPLRDRWGERVTAWREGFEGGSMSPKLVVAAFGAGASLVLVVVLVLVFGLGMFRGTGLTTADLERDAALRAAAERAKAERQGTLNPAAMVQQHDQERAMSAEADSARSGKRDTSMRGARPGG